MNQKFEIGIRDIEDEQFYLPPTDKNMRSHGSPNTKYSNYNNSKMMKFKQVNLSME